MNVYLMLKMKINQLYLRLILTSVFISSTLLANAQNGTIKGQIIDSLSNETVIGAIVTTAENASLGAQTDFDGNFEINNVKPGIYTIKSAYVGYKELIITGVEVKANQVTDLGKLYFHVDHANEVLIIGEKPSNTETAVIEEVRNQTQVVSGISEEENKKTQNTNAAQMVSRVSGVTIIDNSFILVRGLNRRYNGIMLNGVNAPSSEVDSRAFALDLIPSNMIDRMLVFKSGSYDLPGDMTGSLIKLYTKSSVSKRFNEVSLGLGFRVGTTFTNQMVQNTGGTSFLGFDKSRHWPSAFPENLKSPDVIYNSNAQEEAAKSLTNDWDLVNRLMLPDGRFGFTTGNFFHLGKVKVSNISSFNISKTTVSYQVNRTRNLYVTSTDFNPLFDFKDNVTQQNSRLGLISNFNFHLNDRNTISFKNLYNQSGLAETNVREGLNKKGGSSPNAWLEVQDRSLYYQERGIFTSQIEGDHALKNKKTTLNWATGYSYVFRNEPDWKRAGYQRTNLSNDTFRVVIPPQATDNDAARFNSELKENIISVSGNFTHQLNGEIDSTKLSGVQLKVGVYAESRKRTFASRWISYVRGNPGSFNYDLEKLPLETIFDDQNINQTTGFVLNEGTDGSNKYDASNLLASGYAGLAIPLFDKLILNGGARVEHNRQQLNTRNSGNQIVKVDNPITNILPSLNLNYNINDKNIFRASYAKTINRPDFRELAPFGFYDFNNNWKINGNPNLKNAESNNIDFRLERYPSEQEMISFGVFYKNIVNPIEFYIQPIGGQDQNYEYRNAPKANVYGLEIEFKKSLAFISQKMFKHVSFMTNASVIKSEVSLGSSQGGQADKRALVGQSPYIINAGLYYDNKDKGWNIGLNYNMFGNRILSVGDQNFATLYELTRNIVDLTVTKTVRQKLDIKFGISDLLNAPVRYAEDSDRNFKINSNDQVVTKYRRGSYFTLGATYKF